VARVDERGPVRKEWRVMDRDQSRSDHWIEWMILVLGLAGVVAIFVPFAYDTSPWGAVPWFVNPLVIRSEQYPADSIIASGATGALRLAGLLSFFLAPLVSLAQLSRCLARPCSIRARRVHTVAALVAIAGCLAILVVCVKEGVSQQRLRMGSEVAVFIASAIIVGVLVLWRRASKRHAENSAECLLMGAYIGGVATWAAAFAYYLEPTAVVAGFTCVVYAVSLWRRVRA